MVKPHKSDRYSVRFSLTEIKNHMNTCKYLLFNNGLSYSYLKRTSCIMLSCFANKTKRSYTSVMSAKDLERKKKMKT